MISSCSTGGSGLFGLEEGGFLHDAIALMILVIPIAIGYTLWRIFVTDPTGHVKTSILGLDENKASYTEAYDSEISGATLFLYGLTALVFSFEVFGYLIDLLSM